MHQFSTPVRNAMLDAIETAIGPSPILRIRTGAPPANTGAARTGTVLATLNLPADWMANATGGTKAKSGTWEDLSADADGTAGHFDICSSDGVTVGWQGTAGRQVAIPTTAATAANGNVLTFTSTNGVIVGMNVTGTGIAAQTTVVAVTSTTVTLSDTSTGGVASGATIAFSPELVLDNSVFATGQVFTVQSVSLTAPNA